MSGNGVGLGASHPEVKSKPMPTSSKDRSKEEKEKIIQSLYSNKQDWVRHHISSIVQINSLSIGGSSAIVAYFISLRWSNIKPPNEFTFLLIIPMVISLFAIWSTYVIAEDIKATFARIIRIEKHWRVFEIGYLLQNDFILEEKYMNSDQHMPHVARHLIYVQGVVFALTLFVAGLSMR